MSERINVDQAFDPEARQAQQEFDAYMDSRPYQDDNGNTHNPDDGKFVDYDAYHEAKREAHYETGVEASDYSGESLDELAQRVAEARAAGDKTQALDAEEAFFNKFSAYSEKYGWEQDDESAADDVRVDKNAPLTRTTLDDRLARYTSIMYGDEPQAVAVEQISQPIVEKSETQVETRPLGAATWKNSDHDAPVVVTGYLPADKDGREYVSVEGSSTGIPLDEIEFVQSTSGEPAESLVAQENSEKSELPERFDIDKASKEALDRIEQIGADKQKKWEDKVAADEAARQEKEDADAKAAGAVVIPKLNIEDDASAQPISADSVIPKLNIDELVGDTSENEVPRKKRFGERIHGAFVGARNAYLRAGARLQNHGVTTERSFREEDGRIVENGVEEKDHRKLKYRALAVGAFAAGVAGIYIGARHGMFGGTSLSGHANIDADIVPQSTTGGGSNGSVHHAHEVVKSIAENYSVKPGEGYDQLLVDNGIKPTPELLDKIKNSSNPSIRAWTYTMRDGNPGISHSGQMPANVIESIKKLR